MGDPLLDRPAGAPRWVPAVDSRRQIRWLVRAVAAVLLLGVGACVVENADSPPDPTVAEPAALTDAFGTRRISIVNADGREVGWCVLLAETAEQRGRGLMDVTDLEGFAGMLFTFDTDSQSSFYMFDTPMPLTIGWFDSNGSHVTSTDMATCTDVAAGDQCPLFGADGPYRSALEVPQGALAAVGVGPGSVLTISSEACGPDG